VTGSSESRPSSALGYYFKMLTVDNSSNWTSAFALAGPYLIDHDDPTAPAVLGSSSHAPNAASCDPTVVMTWAPATDAPSGLQGYAGVWDHSPGTQPAGAVNLGPGATQHAAQLAPADDWYFHLRAVDLAGNRGPTVHAGPFEVTDSPWSTYCTAKVNSEGCLPALSASGSANLSGSTLTVQADQLLNDKNGLLFWGRAPKPGPFYGGTLCVKAPIVRTTMQSTGGSLPPAADCSGTLTWDFTPAYLGAQGVAAGETLYCQVWTRDSGVPSGTNLTGGLSFAVCPYALRRALCGAPSRRGRGVHPYQGPTVNSVAFERLVVWFEVFSGSRYQSWAWTVAPAPGFWAGRGQLGHQRAFRSCASDPSHWPLVPVALRSPPRDTGGTTHW